MNPARFSKIAESLRQYRRADLKEFTQEVGESPVDQFYVDPLPNDGVLTAVVSSNTTFLVGRKGTGKSTVFAKAQSIIRQRQDVISVYIDVKRLYDIVTPDEVAQAGGDADNVDAGMLREHLVRKHFLGVVLSELLKEIDASIDSSSFLDRWFGRKKSYPTLKENLQRLQASVNNATLIKSEVPVLQKITRKWKSRSQKESGQTNEAKAEGTVSVAGAKASAHATVSDFDKTLEDNEIYNEYSDIILRSFPFQAILEEIQDLLAEVGLARLVVFFDHFSELKYVDQKLFVDVVLGPLNNSSNDKVKLKIAGYPGRIYYGKIDPTKVDTISLDFSDLFEAAEVQNMENSAIDYAERLIRTRFKAFDEPIEEYFDATIPLKDHFTTLFQTTFNVPRLMGALLHICYLDRVSKNATITPQAMRLAAQKYYESTIIQYFDRLNRFALEPFENKMDRHNQQSMLQCLVSEARRVRRGIQDGTVGGIFQEVGQSAHEPLYRVSRPGKSIPFARVKFPSHEV